MGAPNAYAIPGDPHAIPRLQSTRTDWSVNDHPYTDDEILALLDAQDEAEIDALIAAYEATQVAA